MAFKLYFGINFTVEPDTWCGEECQLDDTLVMSKTLNPDRWGGHSIDDYGRRFNLLKIDWLTRAKELGLVPPDTPKGTGLEFYSYHPELLEYCERDVDIGVKTYEYLLREWGDWKWDDAYKLEKCVAEKITRGEHRGFWFNEDKAVIAVQDLDRKMKEISDKVEPLLPPKPISKTDEKLYSFPAKPFKKDGTLSSAFEKWQEKTSAILRWETEGEDVEPVVEWLGKTWRRRRNDKGLLIFHEGPVVTELPATLKDTTHVKEWLVTLSWAPSEWKERDLTTDTKKIKISREKFRIAVEKYIEQTLNSNFKYFRCEYLGVKPEELRNTLLAHDIQKPLRVRTNPSFTEGQDKKICPDLLRLEDKFPYAKEVAEYLTFSHRRSSILGGGVQLFDDEEMEKGYLSIKRIKEDHRVPTPADTCGAATSRFRHRLIVNIPRVTSLYGKELRELFCADPTRCYQIGYDADSLEAKITSHYILPYKGRLLANSLVAEKPNSVHCLNAKKLKISRDEAKTFFYAVLYGAQPGKLAQSLGWPLAKARRIFNEFWKASAPIAELKEKLKAYWMQNGKKFILGIDGRKVPTRSEHALLNSLFQSCGLICMKRAMIIHDRELSKLGLNIDFFRDDWKNKPFVEQMIAYHK